MNAEQLWEVRHLQDKIIKAAERLGNQRVTGDQASRQDSRYMVDIVASAGYHQIQEIVEAFSLDFDEIISNEEDWNRLDLEIQQSKENVVRDLQRQLQLPEGMFLRMGYDDEGNFGLILEREKERAETSANCLN